MSAHQNYMGQSVLDKAYIGVNTISTEGRNEKFCSFFAETISVTRAVSDVKKIFGCCVHTPIKVL